MFISEVCVFPERKFLERIFLERVFPEKNILEMNFARIQYFLECQNAIKKSFIRQFAF